MAKESILDEEVMARIPEEHRELVRAIKGANKWGIVCADETGVVVIPTAFSLATKELKEQFANNAELEALGMNFVKPENKVGHWELDF